MTNFTIQKRRFYILLLTVLCIITIFLSLILVPVPQKKVHFSYLYQNTNRPFTGYAPFAQWYPWQDTMSENLRSSVSLAYAGMEWKDIEPLEGVYDFAALEEKYHLDTLKKSGIRIVLRVLCDYPSEQGEMGIPQWLYEKMDKQGDWYDSGGMKGFSPNYNHPAMLLAHEKMIAALADYYGQDFIAYIQMGTVGQYGEWHTSYGGKMPSEETMDAYTRHYKAAFPHTPLLFRRPFAAAVATGSGYYNDMLASSESTNLWLSWLLEGDSYTDSQPLPDFWNTAPVGGEFAFGDPYSPLEDAQIQETLQQIKASHMSFIGPCLPLAPSSDLEERAQEISSLLGYDLTVLSAQFPAIFCSGSNQVELTLENRGLAPLYYDLPATLFLIDEGGTAVASKTLTLPLSEIGAGGQKTFAIDFALTEPLKEQNYRLAFSICDDWTQKLLPLSNALETDGSISLGDADYLQKYSLYTYIKSKILEFFERR